MEIIITLAATRAHRLVHNLDLLRPLSVSLAALEIAEAWILFLPQTCQHVRFCTSLSNVHARYEVNLNEISLVAILEQLHRLSFIFLPK